MKKIAAALGASLILILALFTAGCASSAASRIQEKSAVFSTLSAGQKANIEHGLIEEGYTPDMVYMALGKPSTTALVNAPEGALETWVYHNYYPPTALSEDSLYLKPTVNSAPRSSGSLSAWGNSSLPSDAGAHGDEINAPRTGGSGGGGAVLPDAFIGTLKVFFRDGKVLKLKFDHEAS